MEGRPVSPALAVRGVRHRYGSMLALDGVDLKTTLIGLATGLLAVQAGTVEVGGADPRRASTRRRLGVVQQSTGFPRTLTVNELVRGAAVRVGRRPQVGALVIGPSVGAGARAGWPAMGEHDWRTPVSPCLRIA